MTMENPSHVCFEFVYHKMMNFFHVVNIGVGGKSYGDIKKMNSKDDKQD